MYYEFIKNNDLSTKSKVKLYFEKTTKSFFFIMLFIFNYLYSYFIRKYFKITTLQ